MFDHPLERLNREAKRRSNVVGIFPHPDALQRLAACVLTETPVAQKGDP